MKRLIKLLLALTLTLVLVIVAGGAVLGMFVDPNDYKSEIEHAALEQAGIELKINGDIGWSVFPWLGLELNQISAQYPNQPQLAQLKQAQVSIRLPALLSGQVEMQSIVVDGLALNLVQHKDGKNNWSLASTTQASASTTKTDNAAQASGGAAIGLDINSIEIRDAALSFDDKINSSRVELTELNIQSGKVVLNQAFPLAMSFNAKQFVTGTPEPTIQLNSSLETQVLLDIAKQHYQLKSLSSTLTVNGQGLPSKGLTLSVAADINANIAQQKVTLDQLTLAIANLQAGGNISLQDFSKPQLQGQLTIADFNLKALLAELGQPAIVTQDEKALTKIALALTLDGKPGTVAVDSLTLKLDDSTFKGNAAFNIATGHIKLALSGDQLNADRYMPPANNTEVAPASTSQGQSTTKAERYSKEAIIPVEPLKALALDANIKLAKLHVQKLDLSKLELDVKADKGLVNIGKIHADLYGGTVRNKIILDARTTPLKIHSIKKVSHIQIGDMLKAAADVDKLTGSLSSQSDITTRGRSVYDIVHSMNGTAAVQMKDGEIKGIDMAQTLCQGMNTVGSLGINTQEVDRSTPFADLSASTKIRNGVINNPDLSAALDAINLKGKGTVDLPKEAIDYRLALVINGNLFKKTCSIPNKLENVEWPVDCKGGFDTPPAQMCKPDLSVFENIFKAKAKAKLDAVKEKAESKLKQKLEEKLGGDALKDKLKGLFGS